MNMKQSPAAANATPSNEGGSGMLEYPACVRRLIEALGYSGSTLPDLPQAARECIINTCREYAAGEKTLSKAIRSCRGATG